MNFTEICQIIILLNVRKKSLGGSVLVSCAQPQQEDQEAHADKLRRGFSIKLQRKYEQIDVKLRAAVAGYA